MTDNLNSENSDAALAEFADQLLAGEENVAYETTHDSDMQTLQATVLRIHSAFGDPTPPTEMVRRIRANLEQAWQQVNTRQQPVIARLLRNLSGGSGWQSRRQRQTLRVGITLATLAAVTLVFAFVLGTGGSAGDSLGGATFGEVAQITATILLPVLIVLGGLLWWDSRRDS